MSKGMLMLRSLGFQAGSLRRGAVLAVLAVAALLLLHDAPNAAWAQGRELPGTPQNVTVTPGDASLTLTWEAPSSWGLFPATGYSIDWYAGASPPANRDDWERATLEVSPLAATATSYTFTGTYEGHTVANGTTYQLRIRAFSVNPDDDTDTLPSFWVIASGTPASADATLSDLTIANATTGSDASAGGVWAYGPRVYTAVMLQEITSVTVRPTATDGDDATITVQLETGGTPQAVASGADSAAIAVAPHADPDEWHNIIVTVTAENGSDALTYTLRVYQYPPVSFDATVPNLTFTQGEEVYHAPLPSASDDYEVSYTATGLPAGLSLSSVHRSIVGTPTTVTTAPANVTYTATGELGGTASLTFDVSVAPPVTFDQAARDFCSSKIVAFTGDEEWLDAGDDGTVTYPAASGGAEPLTYSLIESDSQQPLSSVASGITFDPATRKLGGTPSQEARRQWSVTYAAEDKNGSRAACTTAVHAGGFGGL